MKEEHYEDSQSRHDYKINKYTLHCLFVALLVGSGVWLANLLNIFIVNQTLMTQGYLSFTLPVLIMILICRVVDMHLWWVKYMLLFGVILAVTIMGITLTYHTVLISVFPLLLAIQYTNKRMILYTYILTFISIFVIVMGGFYWGVCDANMLTLTTEQMDYYVNRVTGTIQLVAINDNPWYTLPMYFVLPRCLLLSLLYPVMKSITSNILDYTQYARNMKKLSEMDGMTGLYNKNKYLQIMEDTYPDIERVAVIFWDVNNLKKTNDTLGHAEGDYLITTVAKIIQDLTDERKKAYRIGGDEFVMVIGIRGRGRWMPLWRNGTDP